MWKEQFIHQIRLRLITLVLALLLTWCAMNPAPVQRVRRGEEQPDEKRREAKSPPGVNFEQTPPQATAMKSVPDSFSSAGLDVHDLEWPDVIDVR
jgi:flagellar biosynthesis/type III secretory pathway M-ring protein FliF/YscJ